MTDEKRFTYENHKVKDNLTGEEHSSNMVSVNVLNALYDENMSLRRRHTRLIILLKDIIKDLKRMDTKGYAEHVEKIGNIEFLSMEDNE